MRSAKDILYGKRSAKELLGAAANAPDMSGALDMTAPESQPDVTGVSPMAQMGLIKQPEMLSTQVAKGVETLLGPPEPIGGRWMGPLPPVGQNFIRSLVNVIAGTVPGTIDIATRPMEMLPEMGKAIIEQGRTIDEVTGKLRPFGSTVIPTDIQAIPSGAQKLGLDPIGPLVTAAMLAGAIKGVRGLRKPTAVPKIAPVEVAPEPILRGKTVLEEMAPEKPVEVAKAAPATEVVDVNKFQNVNLEHIPADLQVEVEAIGARSGKITKIKDTAANAIKEVENRISQYKALWECLKA